MSTSRSLRLFGVVLIALALSLVLAVGTAAPSYGTEGEEVEKVALPSNPHDQVGLIILGVMGLGVAAAGLNAFKQLRGERPQADGKIRWR